jgi:ribosomal protein S1
MDSMNTSEWDALKASMPIGTKVRAKVVEQKVFGLFVETDSPAVGIIERIHMAKLGYAVPENYPAIGQIINCEVLGFRDWSQQVELKIAKKE